MFARWGRDRNMDGCGAGWRGQICERERARRIDLRRHLRRAEKAAPSSPPATACHPAWAAAAAQRRPPAEVGKRRADLTNNSAAWCACGHAEDGGRRELHSVHTGRRHAGQSALRQHCRPCSLSPARPPITCCSTSEK
eukprot:scaffold26125_cov103-Isochrysis_galbana.AAC.3